MATLSCDICNGKLTIGAGGVAICENCGMEHSKERLQEELKEINGTVPEESPRQVDNYLSMAESAYEAENKSEAERYCNKIIEIAPTNYKAWFLKGKAAGWQSTIANIRFKEGVTCFAKAIDSSPNDMKEAIKTDSAEEIKKLALALISLRAGRFIKSPDEEETIGFTNDINIILEAVTQLASKSGVVATGFMEPIATLINTSVVASLKKILPEYTGDDENRPDKYRYEQFLIRIGYCTMLLEKAIGLSDEDNEEDIQRYENLIALHAEAIKSCSWDYEYNEGSKLWKKEYQLNDAAITFRKNRIAEYRDKISQIRNNKEHRKEPEQGENEKGI